MDTHFGVGQVKGFELFHIVPAEVAKHRCIRNARVTFTENETVSVLPLGVLFLNVEVSVVHDGKNVHNAHTAADVPAARPHRGLQAKVTQVIGLFFQRQPFFLG